MLEQFFLKIINMSWEASIVIAIVIIVRALLKKFPKFISYMLWSVAFFRLLCPVSLETSFSPVVKLNMVFQENVVEETISLEEGYEEETAQKAIVPHSSGETQNEKETESTASKEVYFNADVNASGILQRDSFIFWGKYIWIFGLIGMFLYCFLSGIKMYHKTRVSIPIDKNIHLIDEEISPFVMGIFKPVIYLPENLNKKEQEYIILHEKLHIRRLDHIAKPVAFLAVCIHWFNPMVWIAFTFFCKDMEMSCDEAVIKEMGEDIRADYSASLLALSAKNLVIRGLSVDFGEGNTKERVKNIASRRKTKKWMLATIIIGVIAIIVCLTFTHKHSDINNKEPQIKIPEIMENVVVIDNQEEAEVNITLHITEQYNRSTGDPSNLYYIDENNILWGSGRNEYGQLGQGTQDYEFHGNNLQIAENVIHVDYSQKGFAIYLTDDYKLYGMGNAGSGALQQYETFDWIRYTNGTHYAVTSPILLMEDVIYACCGRDDIVCMQKDGTVWTWGTICVEENIISSNAYFFQTPQKILENAVLVTGGWFNHAALLQDGTVWTWGYNSSGNCGVADPSVVSKPTMVAEDVVMVWTNLAVSGYPQPDTEDIVAVWTGNSKYDTEYDNIAAFDEIYPRYLNNTVILKVDGSYWVCGENVGETERIVHGAEGDYSVICTHEFYPYNQSPSEQNESKEGIE